MAHLQIPEKAEKLIADVFEAYIGGVITSNPNGKVLIHDFLKDLLEPTLAEHRMILDGTIKVDKLAVSKLYALAMTRKKKVEFRFEDSGINGAEDRWEAVCFWSGTEVGRAKARNQQEAKHRTASLVLKDLQN